MVTIDATLKQNEVLHFGCKQTLEKTEGPIKKGQSRDTSNIGQTRHMTMTNKTKKSQQNTENLKDELQGPCNKK
jgi:hypothetical protein